MIDCFLVVFISAITELGIVLTHVWASPSHEHFSQQPWWPKLNKLKKWNWYHLASFAGHWPIQFGIWYFSQTPWWILIIMAVVSKAVWYITKRVNNKSHWGSNPFA
jgi:hypothetical protein